MLAVTYGGAFPGWMAIPHFRLCSMMLRALVRAHMDFGRLISRARCKQRNPIFEIPRYLSPTMSMPTATPSRSSTFARASNATDGCTGLLHLFGSFALWLVAPVSASGSDHPPIGAVPKRRQHEAPTIFDICWAMARCDFRQALRLAGLKMRDYSALNDLSIFSWAQMRVSARIYRLPQKQCWTER